MAIAILVVTLLNSRVKFGHIADSHNCSVYYFIGQQKVILSTYCWHLLSEILQQMCFMRYKNNGLTFLCHVFLSYVKQMCYGTVRSYLHVTTFQKASKCLVSFCTLPDVYRFGVSWGFLFVYLGLFVCSLVQGVLRFYLVSVPCRHMGAWSHARIHFKKQTLHSQLKGEM